MEYVGIQSDNKLRMVHRTNFCSQDCTYIYHGVELKEN